MPTKTKAQIEAEKKAKETAEQSAPTTPEAKTVTPETNSETPDETGFGLTTESFSPPKIEEPEETEPEAEEVKGKVEEPVQDEEVIVKQGPRKVNIRALQPNGSPFTGHYGTLFFDHTGVAVISESDLPSVEKLREQFKSLEIEQI